jgi:hypothetical protein
MNSGSGKMGATPHTTNDSLAWLRERFKDRLISRKCEIKWAAHSPDNTTKNVQVQARRGVLQNFAINAVDILVIDFYALHIRTIDASKGS